MGKFRCKYCGAEYDSMPRICETPGCNNSNPAMWEVIAPPQSAVDQYPHNNVGSTNSGSDDKKEERLSKKQSRKEEKRRLKEQQQLEKELRLQEKRGKKKGKKALLIVCLSLVALLIIAIIGTEENPTPQPNIPGISDNGDTTPQPDTPGISDSGNPTPQPQPTKVNVMAADEIDIASDESDYYLFGSDSNPKRSEIATIEFVNNLDTAPPLSKKGDVSKDRDGSVYAWTTPCNDVSIDNYENLYDLHFAAQGKISPESCKTLFAKYTNLVSIDFNDAFDTSMVTNMNDMFSYCESLKKLDLTNFDTSNVTKMDDMFRCCHSLKELDLRGFETSKVTDMSWMFSGCISLKKLDVTNFDTSTVTNMSSMFNYCESLEKIDVSSFKTSKVTDMSYMFYNCISCYEIDISNFSMKSVTDVCYMFYKEEPTGEYNIYLPPNFNPKNVPNNEDFFEGDWRSHFS